MHQTINRALLKQLAAHHRRLGLKYRLKGLPYERCAELSWAIDYVSSRLSEPLRYLDIGTGESPLPTYLSAYSAWDITCLDKCPWVRNQYRFLRQIKRRNEPGKPFRVIEKDLLNAGLPEESFDIITCISVIEHFEGHSDAAAIAQMSRLLRPGGMLLVTTPVNEPFFAEFYLDKSVYGDEFRGSPVYYQRHYDVKSIAERLVQPSNLTEKQRVYFGDYGFQCFERVLQKPWPLRALYAWNTPWLASRHLSYRSSPVGRKDMRMNTASGLILVLAKPAPAAQRLAS